MTRLASVCVSVFFLSTARRRLARRDLAKLALDRQERASERAREQAKRGRLALEPQWPLINFRPATNGIDLSSICVCDLRLEAEAEAEAGAAIGNFAISEPRASSEL